MPESIAIRPYRQDDAPGLYASVAESLEALTPWMPWATADYRLAQAEDFLSMACESFTARAAFEFAICDASGRHIGGCGVNQVHAANRFANLGYWVRSSMAGQGVATHAVRQLASWIFAHTLLERLEIVVAVGNVGSQRVAQKAGATREGLLRRRLVLGNEPTDAVMFSVIRGDVD